MRRLLILCAALALVACEPSGLLSDDDDLSNDDDVSDDDDLSNDDDASGPDALATAQWLYDPLRVVQIDIEIDPQDAAALAGETNSIFDLLVGEDCMDQPFSGPFNWYPAHITIDGERIENVGLRKKGLIGSLSTTKPSLKVKFDKFEVDQTFGGLERLTLNNSISDPTLVKQCLGYQLFADAGIAAPRCNFAHVTANGLDLGVFVNVEPLKKTFLKAAYDGNDEGDLYEGTLSDFRAGWTETFEAETGATDPLRGPIHAVTEALEIADDTAAFAALEQVLDLPAFHTFWAMEVLIGHLDGYTGNRNNFYVYRPEGEDRLEFLPWGIDAIFRDGAAFGADTARVVFAGSALPRRLWENPAQRALYVAELERLIDQVWDADALDAEIDRMVALIDPFDIPVDSAADSLAALVDFVANRGDRVLAALGEELPEFEQPLSDVLCLIESGELRVDFATTMGTLGSLDPLTEGSSHLVGEVDGVAFDVEGGAVGGIYEGQVVIGAQGLSAPGVVLQSVAVLPGWALGENPVPIGGFGSAIYLTETDFNVSEEAEYLGSIWNGSLTFTALAAEPGSALSGFWEGPTYRSAF